MHNHIFSSRSQLPIFFFFFLQTTLYICTTYYRKTLVHVIIPYTSGKEEIFKYTYRMEPRISRLCTHIPKGGRQRGGVDTVWKHFYFLKRLACTHCNNYTYTYRQLLDMKEKVHDLPGTVLLCVIFPSPGHRIFVALLVELSGGETKTTKINHIIYTFS